MLARRQDQSTTILYSYGILRVVMTGAAGESLQLAPGQTSTLVVDIPESQLATAPATIPLWYFDETAGVWQEEGQATRQGDKYTGTVKHFTDWNCDAPSGVATLRGRLVDCRNQPVGGSIEIGQIAAEPQVFLETNETDGKFARRVPSGVDLTVVLNDPLLITPLTGEGRGKLIVVVPALKEGQVYDLGDVKVFPCPSEVTATFKTKPGDKVKYVLFSTQHGAKSVWPGQTLKASLPPNAAVTMTITTESGVVVTKEITTPADGGLVALGIIDLDASSGPVEKKVYITGRTTCHGNPENTGQIAATWKDETGSGDGEYAAPSADGSFRIAVPPNTSVRIQSNTQHDTWSRVVQTPATPGEVLDLGAYEACDNPAIGPTSFVINGDGFNNQLETLLTNENVGSLSNAKFYGGSSQSTWVEVQRPGRNPVVKITFPGKQTGKMELTKTTIQIEYKVDGKYTYYEASSRIAGSSMQVEVIRYGNVGEPITATFSGTLVRRGDPAKTVTITNGKIEALRSPD
jgi:hypothetical protein